MGKDAHEEQDLFVLSSADSGWQRVEISPASPKPAARSYCAMASSGSKLFVFGGTSGHARVNDLWSFDSVTNVWSLLHEGGSSADVPSIRGGAALFASGKAVYLFCGFNKAELADCWRFSDGQWTRLASTPGARSVFACTALGPDAAVLFGGERQPSPDGHAGAGEFHSDVVVFDAVSEQFSHVAAGANATMVEPRGWMEMALVDSAASSFRVLLVGGLSQSNQRLQDAFILQLDLH